MSTNGRIIKEGLLAGIRCGLRSFFWMVKIILPVSLAVVLLEWLGWLNYLDPFMSPLMGWLNLPPEATLPILVGLFTDVYGAIAVMVALSFSVAQMTLISIFLMVAHSIVIEGIIQSRSGISFVRIILIRLGMAFLTVFVCSRFFEGTGVFTGGTYIGAGAGLWDVLAGWAADMVPLVIKILVIAVSVMVFQELLARFGVINRLIRFFRPVMRFMGLPEKATVAWLTAVMVGLTYGVAIVVEESRRGLVSARELERLHVSIGINHSMVEDVALFGAIGVGFGWVIFPRLIAALVAVRLVRLIRLVPWWGRRA